MTKREIRSKILVKLKTQKEAERKRKSKIIKEKLFQNAFFKKAKIVMFYLALGGEVETQGMIRQAKKLGKIIAVPVCSSKRTLEPCRLDLKARLEKGHYGIPEPASKSFITAEDLDLVIVPGIAFDRKGHRLGRGKGYYDNFLKKLPERTLSIGLAFDFQVLPSIPTTPRDVKVHAVLFA